MCFPRKGRWCPLKRNLICLKKKKKKERRHYLLIIGGKKQTSSLGENIDFFNFADLIYHELVSGIIMKQIR